MNSLTLLKRHIFGVDMDEDACSVAEFSLYLTLLDYVKPADLIDHPRFRLPTLRKKNIFKSDFFAFQPFRTKFHWIAGQSALDEAEGRAGGKQRNGGALEAGAGVDEETHSCDNARGKNAVAQAFAWRCREFMAGDGVCALLIPSDDAL